MPEKNGREAYNEIQKIKPDIKVIFMSGYTKDVFVNKGIEDKKFNFLQKPISPRVLLQKVREVLNDKQKKLSLNIRR
jgi:two-component system, cell cycle sensor histidine kinase and response regulator CckA